jgi:hypothetical protein
VATLKVIYFLDFSNNVFLIIKELVYLAIRSAQYLIKKPPVITKWMTIIVIKAKSCNALLHIVLVRISSCAK